MIRTLRRFPIRASTVHLARPPGLREAFDRQVPPTSRSLAGKTVFDLIDSRVRSGRHIAVRLEAQSVKLRHVAFRLPTGCWMSPHTVKLTSLLVHSRHWIVNGLKLHGEDLLPVPPGRASDRYKDQTPGVKAARRTCESGFATCYYLSGLVATTTQCPIAGGSGRLSI